MKTKWKSIIKKTMIVIASLLLLGLVFANIDYNRTNKGKPPILAIHVGKNKFTNADIYYGLGYMVVKCPEYENGGKRYGKEYKLYFLDRHHVCITSYDVEVTPIEKTDK